MSDQPRTSAENVSETAVEIVETFMRRVFDHDLVFAKEAGEIILLDMDQPLPAETLAANLAHLMTLYQKNRDKSTGLSYAQQMLIWINRAYTYGVIKEGDGLITKLGKCQEEKAGIESDRAKLQLDIETLSSEVSYMKGRILELERGRRIISRVGEDG